jgi:hypothetical protein
MKWVVFILLVSFTLFTAEAQRTAETTRRFPVLYWAQGIETAESVKRTGIETIAVPHAAAADWRKAGFTVVPMSEQELNRREKLLIPRTAGRGNVASATRRPWIDANGWRFIRKPAGKYLYDLTEPARRSPPIGLALAEAFAYKADAVVRIGPAEIEEAGAMVRFLRELPGESHAPLADFGVVDTKSPALDEVLNLLTRRNLLFRLLPAPSPNYRVNVRIGAPGFPESAAADPSAFAQQVRAALGDEHRTIRIYGSETVIARLTGDGRAFRLHLLNYSGREIEGLRVRIARASLEGGKAWAFGVGTFAVETPLTEAGAVEFTIPRMIAYAVIDGARMN